MIIQLEDSSYAGLRWINGACRISYFGLGRVITLPADTEVTINFLNLLQKGLKDGSVGTLEVLDKGKALRKYSSLSKKSR